MEVESTTNVQLTIVSDENGNVNDNSVSNTNAHASVPSNISTSQTSDMFTMIGIFAGVIILAAIICAAILKFWRSRL